MDAFVRAPFAGSVRDQQSEQGKNAQVRQSTRWMPRRTIPMKDAETGETFKGSCMQAMSLENPNGATPPG